MRTVREDRALFRRARREIPGRVLRQGRRELGRARRDRICRGRNVDAHLPRVSAREAGVLREWR